MIITINPGSATIKFAAFVTQNNDLVLIHKDDLSSKKDYEVLLKEVLHSAKIQDQPSVIVHRVVHGGPILTSHQIIDDKVLSEIKKACVMAPKSVIKRLQAFQW